MQVRRLLLSLTKHQDERDVSWGIKVAIMKVAMIGLGKMGEALAYRALQAGHELYGFDVSSDSCAAAEKSGVQIVGSIANFADKNIHVFWLMVPQGDLVDKVIE